MAKNVLRGRNLILKYRGSAIPVSTSCKISLGTSTVDSTTKDDSEDWEDIDIVTENWSLTADKLVQIRTKRTEGTLPRHATLKADVTVSKVGEKFRLIGKNVPIDTGDITEAVWLNSGDHIRILTSPDALCRVNEMAEGDEAEVVFLPSGTDNEFTAEKSGWYFNYHYTTTITHADNYVLFAKYDAFMEILAEAPVEAEVEFDIEGSTYTGKVLITQNNLDGTVKQNSKQSVSMQGTGPLSKKI